MKVGTDGVLLGAWADCKNCDNILDIGTGTGLIALMMAQRSTANIHAVELDENSAFQAKENIQNSKWKDRIQVFNTAIQEFYPDMKYDLIISNPPFFKNCKKAPDYSRTMARHTDLLSTSDLFKNTTRLLNEKGKAAFIFPFSEKEAVFEKSAFYKLHPVRELIVIPVPGKKPKRFCIEFSLKKMNNIESNSLIIEEQRHQYTKEYMALTKDFYLKMPG